MNEDIMEIYKQSRDFVVITDNHGRLVATTIFEKGFFPQNEEQIEKALHIGESRHQGFKAHIVTYEEHHRCTIELEEMRKSVELNQRFWDHYQKTRDAKN